MLIESNKLISRVEQSLRNNNHKENRIALNHLHEHQHFLNIIAQQECDFDKEKVIAEISNNYRVVTTDEDLEWNRAISKALEIINMSGLN